VLLADLKEIFCCRFPVLSKSPARVGLDFCRWLWCAAKYWTAHLVLPDVVRVTLRLFSAYNCNSHRHRAESRM
jgi:hypothetical protein